MAADAHRGTLDRVSVSFTTDTTPLPVQAHTFASKTALLQTALRQHRSWIESTLAVTLDQTIALSVDIPLTQLAVTHLFGLPQSDEFRGQLAFIESRVASIERLPGEPPLLEVSMGSVQSANISQRRDRCLAKWIDGPVALRLYGFSAPLIALCLHTRTSPDQIIEDTDNVLILPSRSVSEVLELLEEAHHHERRPKLRVHHGESCPVRDTSWNDIVLDEQVSSLLKDDFESFFDRELWFRQHNLPFRRGYLLHGPPGNGKTSVVRAMMCSRQLDAYTLRLSSPHTDDSDLEAVFARAADRGPSILLFEDLDRAFPGKGGSHSKVTLQSLLNCLDGAATQDGTIVIATANEPTALDPAILRRPGRFDRVVHFPNPKAHLRRACFRKLNPALAEDDLAPAVTATEGFSFAQLRETYILAGQRSFERGDEITALDLFAGVQALRQGWAKASERIERRGFVPELARV